MRLCSEMDTAGAEVFFHMNKTLKCVLISIWLIGSITGYFSISRPRKPAVASDVGNHVQGIALSPDAGRAVVALLATSDMVALRDQLKTLGVPDDLVRAIVTARITERYKVRSREIKKPRWRE